MADIRRRKLKNAVWLPLRAAQYVENNGRYGYLGFKEDFIGAGSLSVPLDKKSCAEKLDWMKVGLGHNHSGCYDNGKYIPADIYEDYKGEFTGVHLVLDQRGNSVDMPEWHLHQDLVVTLGLKREKDIWVSPSEGYTDVARLHRGEGDKPTLLEIRADHLKDYLCARNMGLYVTSYYSRHIVTDNVSHIDWGKGFKEELTENDRWEGRVIEIHEGGHPFGEKVAVFHSSRTDVEESDDIPSIAGIPTDKNIKSSSWEKGFKGKKLYRVQGELWRTEWIEPSNVSPRVKGDKLPPTAFYTVDEKGTRENKEALIDSGRWLWFKPEVIMALAHCRGGKLAWYTRDTGSVTCSPEYSGVHFGVNKLGLINVYAKDVALLPDWQQQIWAGHNVSPEGGVSEELLAAQVRAQPASTQAPEEFLKRGITFLNELAIGKLGFALFRTHELAEDLLEKTNRFRAIDDAGLFALAKDVARLIADSLDTNAMQRIVQPPKNTKWGSLKTLENLIALKIDANTARTMVGPLVGAYELRHADAHLPGHEIDDAFDLLKIDRSQPIVFQGYQLLHSCVSSLYGIVEVLKVWD